MGWGRAESTFGVPCIGTSDYHAVLQDCVLRCWGPSQIPCCICGKRSALAVQRRREGPGQAQTVISSPSAGGLLL